MGAYHHWIDRHGLRNRNHNQGGVEMKIESKFCKDCKYRVDKQCKVKDSSYVPRKNTCEEFKSKK
jgi:hypothetical protein